jgi:hypothetical protein
MRDADLVALFERRIDPFGDGPDLDRRAAVDQKLRSLVREILVAPRGEAAARLLSATPIQVTV